MALTKQAWQRDLAANWKTYYDRVRALGLESNIETLVALILAPFATPGDGEPQDGLATLVASSPRSGALTPHVPLKPMLALQDVRNTVTRLIDQAGANPEVQEALNFFILESGVLDSFAKDRAHYNAFLKSLLNDAWRMLDEPSGFRVVVEQIVADGHVIIAGGNANIVADIYKGDKLALKSYLANLRAEWNRPDLSRIFPTEAHQSEYALYIHRLYTPLDVWRHNTYEVADDDTLTRLRFQAVNEELAEARRAAIEMISVCPYLVITGAAGTGKSYLARYLASCLAYACDPDSPEQYGVDGLQLLGSAWVHGAILPLFVPLRNFAASPHFAKSATQASSKHLLTYLQSIAERFAPFLEDYLLSSSTHAQAILILDGLDEVNREKDRIIIQKIIEQWADRFPQCRILITTRTYAYKANAKWRMSARFRSAELAPFSRKQITTYITNWYRYAALTRAATFGGKDVAQQITRRLAEDLTKPVNEEDSPLLPLMRQPLLLSMLTLIHETNKQLPEKTAELYEATIDLLNRWTPLSLDGDTTGSAAKLDRERLLNALKLAAFSLQCKQHSYNKYPGTLVRSELRKYLHMQDQLPGGLGVSIDHVLEHLGTRNGVLLSDKTDHYRFPHLTIQEYLAACALIELYDECEMPPELVPADDVWQFPANLAMLLSHDPYRWRNVALFVGAVISGNKGQDGRWALVEELLPSEVARPLNEDAVFRIYVAGEIWASGFLKARLPSHQLITNNLKVALKSIQTDERLDAPERNRTNGILKILQQATGSLAASPTKATSQQAD